MIQKESEIVNSKKIGQRYMILFSLIMSLTLLPFFSFRASANSEPIIFGEEGEYGSIYGDEYDPDNGDTSKWLTIKPGDLGVRIVDDHNQDIFRVDKFGGVYINGELYVNNEKYLPTHAGIFTPDIGFLYFLVIISLIMNIYYWIKDKNSH